MAVKVTNFNRIITLKFYASNKNKSSKLSIGGTFNAPTVDYSTPAFVIQCPKRGQKPDIEITGQYLASSVAQSFNIRVRNLYLDLSENNYTQIEVIAGYENNLTVAFRGTILYAFKESPGPQSTTVIQCLMADVNPWLTAMVNLNITENVTLENTLKEFCKQLSFPEPRVSSSVASITAPEKQLVLCGQASSVFDEIKARFNLTDDILLTIEGDQINAYKKDEGKSARTITLYFLSAPPQLVGGGENSVVANITAPWKPELRPGDIVNFSAQYYSTSSVMMAKQTDITMRVNTISVQFATVKGNNQMTVNGTIIPKQKSSIGTSYAGAVGIGGL